MTSGEKMVWAAVFAQNYKITGVPSHVVINGKMEEWLQEQMENAIEVACCAVERLRSSKTVINIRNAWENNNVDKFYGEMINDDNRNS